MDIKAMLGKKSKIDPMDKEAKLGAIKDMRKMAGDMMADGIKGKMEKVTVAAPDKEALAMGLDKAKEMVSPEDESVESAAEELSESPEHESDEMLEACDTPEKIDELMKKLAEKKAALAKE
jgi:hypothetical protein